MKKATKTNAKSTKKELSKPVDRSRVLAVRDVQGAVADRTYYIKYKAETMAHFISLRTQELYRAVVEAFSLDSMDWSSFKRYLWPTLSSGCALLVGDYLTRGASLYQTESEEYDFIYKFFLGSALLTYSIFHRITERQPRSTAEFSAAVASEVVAITYLYSSVFNGSNRMLRDVFTQDYALIASLGSSAILVPSGISYVAQSVQNQLVRREYSKGAQRSDTAVFSSGRTPIANLYLQVNRFLATELMVSSRLFQLGLIADNILYAERAVQKFRNFPALIADVAPSTIRTMRMQQEKIARDTAYNGTLHQVLRFTPKGGQLIALPRYQLRTGDLVKCDVSIDYSSVPVSGELIALKRDAQGDYLHEAEQRKFSVNLKAQNGEDKWIEYLSNSNFVSGYKKVDLYAVRDGKQAGVLAGDQLNLYGHDHFFIQILPEKELILSSNYEKKAVINQIIADRKQRSVAYSILASMISALIVQQGFSSFPTITLKLMFGLFQTMIPFSEAFLRETVNNRLMKELNSTLRDAPFETIDALRVVDLCNALSGYYSDRFPNGVAIISDKTGTLTTNHMDVLGLWTAMMPAHVQQILKESPAALSPDKIQLHECFELFCAAFTNNKKELEPEEFALLAWFEELLGDKNCLQVAVHGNNRFKKTLKYQGQEKQIDTYHLGLYRTYGGRFTLVSDNEQHYIIFCGVPKQAAFQETSLFRDYSAMVSREGVLARDWCIARAPISTKDFAALMELFAQDDRNGIEAYLKGSPELIQQLKHYATFIIDNPVKKGAEHFIERCKTINVPVFVATGDTTKAAGNIVKVLCPSNAAHLITVRAEQLDEAALEQVAEQEFLPGTTVIFSGVNDQVLAYFGSVLDRDPKDRPVVIFAEMSTEGKGALARYLKDRGSFVVANGDGTNDVMMMKNADLVIAHYSDDATFAPGVGALANISDEQMRRLLGAKQSFYELFDVDLQHSAFIKKFAPLANSQAKPSLALAIKSSKWSFELMRALGFTTVKEMQHQHWFSVAFDLLWLWIALYEINDSSNLPMDNKNINASSFISQAMTIAMAFGALQSLVNWATAGEATNLTSMMLMLSFLPLVLRSVFSGFKMVQHKLFPKEASTSFGTFFHTTRPSGVTIEEIEEDEQQVQQEDGYLKIE
jgi:hypothetical protein